MDKLELDARVARLERSLSRIKVFIGAGVVVAACAGLMMTRVHRSAIASDEATTRETAVTYTSPAPTPVAPMPPSIQVYAGAPEPICMSDLARQLREVEQLRRKNLLGMEERDAKKRQLLARPLSEIDMPTDLEEVKSLWDEQMIDGDENTALRKKVLELVP